MQKKTHVKLPEKKSITKIVFEKPIPCALKLSFNGIKVEEANDAQLKDTTIPHCIQPVFPPLFPQCGECLKKNVHDRYAVDKKGRESKFVK